jgi:hypothetical protein
MIGRSMNLRKLDRFALRLAAIPISFSVADPIQELLLQKVYYIWRLSLPVDPSAMINAECNAGNGKSISPDEIDRPRR